MLIRNNQALGLFVIILKTLSIALFDSAFLHQPTAIITPAQCWVAAIYANTGFTGFSTAG